MRVVSGDVLGLLKSFTLPCAVPPPALLSDDHPDRSNAVTAMSWTSTGEGSHASAHRAGYVAFHSGLSSSKPTVVDLYSSGSSFREGDVIQSLSSVGSELRGVTQLGDLISLTESGGLKVLSSSPCAKAPPPDNVNIPDPRPVTSSCFLRSGSLAVLGGRARPPVIVDVGSGGIQVWKAKNAPHDPQTLLQKTMYQVRVVSPRTSC